MQKLNLEDLIIKKQGRYQVKEIESVNNVAFDTETQLGKCQLIADSFGNWMHTKSIDDCLEFLTKDKNRGKLGWWYNLKYDFQAILKWLPEKLWLKIFKEGKIKYNEYELIYIPKKLLVIKKRVKAKKRKYVRTWKFYDLAQYFRMKLDDAGEKYVGEKKQYHPFDLKFIPDWLMKDKLFISYCVQDAKLTKKLADFWTDLCFSQDLKTKNFCSSASISASYFTKRIKFPTINYFLKSEKLRGYLAYAWNSVSGAFISCYKRGSFKDISVIDINSAYPYELANFPDLYLGDFVFSKIGIPAGSFLGWMKVEININDHYHPCFPILRNNLPNYYPIGRLKTFITLSEYNYFKNIFDIKIKSGLYWIPNKIEYPFEEQILNIYNTRKQTDDGNINYFLKIILNGIYGKFLEKYIELDPDHENYGRVVTGNLFNPMVASYILAGARLNVFQMMSQIDEKDIIACFTDSIVCKKLPANFKPEPQLGAWDLETKGDALILGCGVYTIKGEKIKNKLRGFHTNNKESNNLFKLCERFSNKQQLEIEILENISPMTSLIQHRPDDMNLLINSIKNININFDTKRIWSYYPKNAGEYLDREIDSQPLIHI